MALVNSMASTMVRKGAWAVMARAEPSPLHSNPIYHNNTYVFKCVT